MLKTLSEARRRQLSNLILLGFAAMLLASVWGLAVRVRAGMDSEREAIVHDGQLLAEALDHELDIHVYNVMAMDYLAERFLSGRVRGAENPVAFLVPEPEWGGYGAKLPERFGAPGQLGRITGHGPLPALDDPVAQEMTMAVGLTPLMRAIRARSPYVPWVQYASARGFMFLFPQQGSEGFHFSPALLQRDYFARATPAANPERKVFWSRPYYDAAGKGLIVTVTKPIYQGDRFLGSVSIDVMVASLQRLLDDRRLAHARTQLLGEDGQPIVSATPLADDQREHAHVLARLPLRSAPWTLSLQIKRADLLAASLLGRAWHMAAVGVLGVSLLTLVLLTRSARRVRAMALRDGLTGLYNRRHFDLVARQQVALAQRGPLCLGLALLDIDFFKKYNDHYGHQQGDVALRAVAQALRGALRRGSDQVFRVGGEEFAVLVSLQHERELAPLLAQLNEAVRALKLPHALNPAGAIVTVSIGGVVIDKAHPVTLEAAYQRADAALYQAKNTGRDRHLVLAAAQPD